jgi:hypothetical protein
MGRELERRSIPERTTPAVRRLSSPLLLRLSSLVPSRAVEGHWCLELGQGAVEPAQQFEAEGLASGAGGRGGDGRSSPVK